MYDVVVIGGGIVGLATAYRLKSKNKNLKVAVVEKEGKLAAHQTGHNSGVIHSGIYYKPGSLKAKNCIQGYHDLIRFCDEENIPYDLCGKVIVATDKTELPALQMIYDRGVANGLEGIRYLSSEEIKEKEPYVNGKKGIYVPQTGIIDYALVSQKIANRFQEMDGSILLNHEVTGLQKHSGRIELFTNRESIQCQLVVTCGGLQSDKLARLTDPGLSLKIIPFRGEYYKIRANRSHLVRNLIYPVPDINFPFLGVHFTRMIGGGVEAGPNAVLAFQREGYQKSDINLGEFFETLQWPGFQKVAAKYWKTGFGEFYRSFSKSAFTRALQKLVPEIQEEDLEPGGAGVRAQACDRDGGLLDDFMILEGENYVHVCNAPSPAATSSLSIGETVAKLALERF